MFAFSSSRMRSQWRSTVFLYLTCPTRLQIFTSKTSRCRGRSLPPFWRRLLLGWFCWSFLLFLSLWNIYCSHLVSLRKSPLSSSTGPVMASVPGVPRLPPGKKPPGPPPGPPPPQVLALYGIPSRRPYSTNAGNIQTHLSVCFFCFLLFLPFPFLRKEISIPGLERDVDMDRDRDSGSDSDRDDRDDDSDSEEDSEEEREGGDSERQDDDKKRDENKDRGKKTKKHQILIGFLQCSFF